MHFQSFQHVFFTIFPLVGLVSATPSPLPATAAAAAAPSTFTNPVLWEDYPDLDVFRVGDVFYYSSSTFAYSPGAPVLKSYDLINWEPVTHSVLELNFGARYNLNTSSSAYVKGIWASSLRYRASNDKFYWIGCIESSKTYIWTASGTRAGQNNGEVAPDGWNWTASSAGPINACYYDCGILIDESADGKDDTMYVVYGNTKLSVAQLSADGLRQVKTTQVFAAPSGMTIEGARMYKIKGTYYIFVTRPADAEYVLKASNPLGPYEMRPFVVRVPGPLASAGFSHQGGIVSTPGDKAWYYVAFMDAYPGGRIPVVAPLVWSAEGWPSLVTDSGTKSWGASYPIAVQTNKTVSVPSSLGLDDFKGGKLGQAWEWNHNPDNAKWQLVGASGGLVLRTATVTGDLFAAMNTLTRRILGPKSSGTFRLDVSGMREGDRAGAVLFRDRAAYIGVWKDKTGIKVVMVTGLNLAEGTWTTSGTGTVAATGPILADVAATKNIWLRIEADITPAFGSSTERKAVFSYSLDGKTFTTLGSPFSLSNSWRYFTGYRFGVFNHATSALGGEVTVKSFEMQRVG